MTIGLGIVGCGIIGGVHSEAATRAGQRIIAACDTNKEKADALVERHGGALATTNVDELLNHPEVDAVVIATPNDTHSALALRALEAGRDILLEKPMALSVEQCRTIIDVAQQRQRIVQLSFVCRQSITARAAKQFIESGRLGRIYHGRAMLFRRRGIPGLGHWFTTRQHSGGGVLIDIGVHLIDLLLHLCDSPTPLRISGQTESLFGSPIDQYRYADMWAGPPVLDGTFDVDDHATATLRCAGGVTFDIGVSWASNLPSGAQPDGFVLLGERGGLYFHLWDGRITLTSEVDGKLGDFTPELPNVNAWDDAWQRQHELFAQSVEQRVAPPASGSDGLITQSVVAAWYESAEAQREAEIKLGNVNTSKSQNVDTSTSPQVHKSTG